MQIRFRKRFLVAASILAVYALILFVGHFAFAQGSGSGSGSAVTVDNPTTNVTGWLQQLVSFAHTNWWLAIGAGVLGATELLGLAGKTWSSFSWLAWLSSGRVTLAISGITVVLTTVLNTYLGGGSPQVVLYAAVAAFLAWWHPAATDVAKQKSTTRQTAPTLPTAVPPPSPPGASKGIAKLHVMNGLALAGMAGLLCCSTLEKDASTFAGTFASCAKVDYEQELKNAPAKLLADLEAAGSSILAGLVGNVSALLSTAAASLEADLASIVAIVGIDALDCAELAFEAVVNGQSGAAAGSGSGSGSSLVARTHLLTADQLTKAQAGIARYKKWSATYRAANPKAK